MLCATSGHVRCSAPILSPALYCLLTEQSADRTVRVVNMTVPWEQRPGYLISAVGAHVQIRFTELLAPYGLLPHHFGLLRRVAAQEGRTQQDLADALKMRRAAVVGVVDDLEALGVLERRRHPVDRRANALHLTPAGRRLVAKLTTAITALEDELLAPLPAAARAGFLDGLRQVAVVAGVADGVYPHVDDHRTDPQPVGSPGPSARETDRDRDRDRDVARAGRAIPARRPRTDRKA